MAGLSSASCRFTLTHLSCCFNTLETKLIFPLPGGPVMVMNVLGYSANHLSTFFSASTRSFQASFPIASSDLPAAAEAECRKPNEVGRTNFCRKSSRNQLSLLVQSFSFTLGDGVLLEIPDTFNLRSDKEGSYRIEELSSALFHLLTHRIAKCPDEERHHRQGYSRMCGYPVPDSVRLQRTLVVQS